MFVFTALGVTAIVFRSENIHGIIGIEPLDQLILGLGRLVPYVLVCLAFAFLYAFLTNYRVRLVPALAGGVFASLAWHSVAYLFARLVAGSSKYSAVYSGMAAAVLFIVWLNISWLIVLVGAHIARYAQHPHLLRRHLDSPQVGQIHDQTLALDVMAAIGRTHYLDEPKWTLEALTAAGCYGSPDQVEQLLQALQAGGLTVATNDEPEAYLPARVIETIGLREILDIARARGDESARQAAVQAVVADLEQAIAENLEGKTLKDLVAADAAAP